MTVQELTAAVRQTIGSPFHHGGRVNQVGLDCGGMMIAAMQILGIECYDKPHYNRGDGLADMIEVLEHNNFIPTYQSYPQGDGASPDVDGTGQSAEPTPGDLVLIRSSDMYHHLVYFTEDQTIIHAWFTSGVNKVVETTMLPEWENQIHSIWRYKDLT